MSIFPKRKTYAFSDILKGLQSAISGAQDMLQAQQVQNLSNFWVGEKPVTQKVQLGDKEVEVPFLTLVPHSHLSMDDVEIKFKSRVGDMVSKSVANKLEAGNAVSHAELQMEMDGIKATDNDVMEITIRFKAKATPEGVARLMDEYNKQI